MMSEGIAVSWFAEIHSIPLEGKFGDDSVVV